MGWKYRYFATGDSKSRSQSYTQHSLAQDAATPNRLQRITIMSNLLMYLHFNLHFRHCYIRPTPCSSNNYHWASLQFWSFDHFLRSAKSNISKCYDRQQCDLLQWNSHMRKNSTVVMNVLSFTQPTQICRNLGDYYRNFHQKLQYARWRLKTQRLTVQSQIA